MKRLPLIVFLAVVIAGCSDKGKYSDLAYRDKVMSNTGMIYYGDDPQDEGFDDMYYAFAAGADEMEAASEAALEDFKASIRNMTSADRKYMRYVFNDMADLAEMANYAYKDGPASIPEGWVDRGAQTPEIMEIFNKPSKSRLVPMGLKCSLMSRGDRQVLVFAGTDFPSSWKDFDQVMHFLSDAYEDIYGALNKNASQTVLASKVVDELLAEGYVTKKNLEFAGHSLGGRLASEMSVRYGCPAVIFNAAGVSPDTYQEYKESVDSASEGWRGYIINVVSANDPLTCAQKYLSGTTDPVKTKVAEILSMDNATVDQYVSLGLDIIGAVVDNVMGNSDVTTTVKELAEEYAPVVETVYERDYRAIGAVLPVRENLDGHGILPLAESLRARAEMCK